MKKLTLEHRKKLSLAKLGKKLPPFTEEHKRKISLSNTGKKVPSMIGNKNAKGYTHTAEAKLKISISGKNRKDTPERILAKSLRMRGDRCNFWKGGVTPLQRTLRGCFNTRLWRSDIFTRDNYTCQICGKRGGELNADHYPKTFIGILMEYEIKTYEEAINCEELWNINNGRTLCKECHKNTDTYGHKMSNTKYNREA